MSQVVFFRMNMLECFINFVKQHPVGEMLRNLEGMTSQQVRTAVGQLYQSVVGCTAHGHLLFDNVPRNEEKDNDGRYGKSKKSTTDAARRRESCQEPSRNPERCDDGTRPANRKNYYRPPRAKTRPGYHRRTGYQRQHCFEVPVLPPTPPWRYGSYPTIFEPMQSIHDPCESDDEYG